MRYIKLYEDFQMGDLNFMSPEEIQKLFIKECIKETPDLNLIRVILDNGLVDVNAKDKRGDTPLHEAAYDDNVVLAKLLISAGADVNSKNNRGFTPLYWAVQRNNIALAELLISAGAVVNTKDEDGYSPLDWAVSRSNVEMQTLLKKNGAVE